MLLTLLFVIWQRGTQCAYAVCTVNNPSKAHQIQKEHTPALRRAPSISRHLVYRPLSWCCVTFNYPIYSDGCLMTILGGKESSGSGWGAGCPMHGILTHISSLTPTDIFWNPDIVYMVWSEYTNNNGHNIKHSVALERRDTLCVCVCMSLWLGVWRPLEQLNQIVITCSD